MLMLAYVLVFVAFVVILLKVSLNSKKFLLGKEASNKSVMSLFEAKCFISHVLVFSAGMACGLGLVHGNWGI